jgi:BirA family biotin operon repressor/biotin-[acetyl-CoA-carboxylase] ligase
MSRLGLPRVHYAATDSTNERARQLAAGGAPHGTVVTAASQSAGRGRQGRDWIAPAGSSLLCSVVLRETTPLLPLVVGVAAADALASLGYEPKLKWPNDVHLDGHKVAGILAEGRPAEGWAVAGIGINVAVRVDDLPKKLQETAASLELEPAAVETVLALLLTALEARLGDPEEVVIEAFRERDALLGREISWSGGVGTAAGIDSSGRLIVSSGGASVLLDAGEVHLGTI